MHGEQHLELKRPLPSSATLTHKAKIKEIYDKGKNAVVVTEVRSFDGSGAEIMRNEIAMPPWSAAPAAGAATGAPPPSRPPCPTAPPTPPSPSRPTRTRGAALPPHRRQQPPARHPLSFAGAMGFKRPILHGLCSYGFSARHVVKAFAKNDPRFLRSIRARFLDSVFPGRDLQTEMRKVSTPASCSVPGSSSATWW